MGYAWSFFLRWLIKPGVGFLWFLKVNYAHLWASYLFLKKTKCSQKVSKWVLIWCLKSLIRFLVRWVFLMPGNKVLQAGLCVVKLSDTELHSKWWGRAEYFQLPHMHITHQWLVLESCTNYDLAGRVRWCVLAFWSIRNHQFLGQFFTALNSPLPDSKRKCMWCASSFI